MKSEDGRSQRREGKKREEQRREDQRREDAGARKGRKVAYFFPMICGSGGSGGEPCGQMMDEKLHAVVAKHISKSKCAKHTMSGPLLEVEMSKKCTPFWREAHFFGS